MSEVPEFSCSRPPQTLRSPTEQDDHIKPVDTSIGEADINSASSISPGPDKSVPKTER